MKRVLIAFLIAFPSFVFASDIVFNRLNKLYEKDKNKCLEAAKRHMNWNADRAAPYYFSSVIYQEKSEKSKTLQGQTRQLKKAIGYAIEFEEKDVKNLRSQLNWNSYKLELREQSMRLIANLEKHGDRQFRESLLDELNAFDEEVDLVAEFEQLETNSIDELPENLNANNLEGAIDVSNTLLYGMPTGLEYIGSASEEQELSMLKLINAERKKQGLRPLKLDADLTRACRYHSYDLATQNYFNHSTFDRINGELVQVGGPFDRIKKFYSASLVKGENIAAGNGSADATFDQWYRSQEHYDTMLDVDATKAGVGLVYDEHAPFGYYWTFCTAE